MEFKLVKEAEMTPGTDQKIRENLCKCFPDSKDVFSQTRKWHGSGPAWTVFILEDADIIAHVGIVDRIIRVGDAKFHIAGIQNVFVLPEQRGKGICEKIMEDSMKKAAISGYDFGLLFCVPKLEKVYAKTGWIKISERETVRIDENGNETGIPGKNIAMFYPIKIDKFPPGNIHLQGNDW